jgi:hypothetical protein
MYYKVKQTDPQISLIKYFLMNFGSCKQLYFTWKERDVVNTREAHLRQVQMASYVDNINIPPIGQYQNHPIRLNDTV